MDSRSPLWRNPGIWIKLVSLLESRVADGVATQKLMVLQGGGRLASGWRISVGVQPQGCPDPMEIQRSIATWGVPCLILILPAGRAVVQMTDIVR